MKQQGRHARRLISELNSLPVRTPANASAAASRSPPHSSGPGWVATPSLYGTFIRYSMPVLTGAFCFVIHTDSGRVAHGALLRRGFLGAAQFLQGVAQAFAGRGVIRLEPQHLVVVRHRLLETPQPLQGIG